MPLELGVWRIDSGVTEVPISYMDQERRLEDILATDISIASPNWMVIGRQVRTSFGGCIDILAIDRVGNLVVLELKRNMTPREIVAQILDYASWVQEQEADALSRIFDSYQEKYLHNGFESLDAAFCSHFRTQHMPETLNENHELVVVASALDDSTERIVTYLSETHGVPINAVFFRLFKDDDREYLTRAWYRDPTGTEVLAEETTSKGTWNGEFYVNISSSYDWEKAQKYNYVVAGGGQWYSRTLSLLKDGGRFWLYLPGIGYAGVGIVVDSTPVTAKEFLVRQDDGTEVPLADLPDVDPGVMEDIDEPGKENFLVRVKWLKTLPQDKAIRERGFFAQQNSVCLPKAEKWDHTVKRLKKRFDIQD